MAEKKFKYFRQDFHPLTVNCAIWSCISISSIPASRSKTSWIFQRSPTSIKIELDARDLEIVSVSSEQPPSGLTTGDAAFKYLRDINRLTVIPDRIIRSGEEFKLQDRYKVRSIRQYSGRNL